MKDEEEEEREEEMEKGRRRRSKWKRQRSTNIWEKEYGEGRRKISVLQGLITVKVVVIFLGERCEPASPFTSFSRPHAEGSRFVNREALSDPSSLSRPARLCPPPSTPVIVIFIYSAMIYFQFGVGTLSHPVWHPHRQVWCFPIVIIVTLLSFVYLHPALFQTY